jgi:uncharacterized protein YqgC (DUF456 family)
MVAQSLIPKTGLGQFLFFAVEMFISYAVICANFRAVAKGYYMATAMTDVLIVLQNSVIGKWCIEDANGRSYWAVAGATLGGMCGSLFSIWLTKNIFGS